MSADLWNAALEAAADRLRTRACGYLARHDTIYNGRIVSEELLELAEDILALREADPGGQARAAPVLPLDEYELATIALRAFGGISQPRITFTRWKDGIELEVATDGLKKLAQAIVQKVNSAPASPGLCCKSDNGYCLLCGGSPPMSGGCWRGRGLPFAAAEEGRSRG